VAECDALARRLGIAGMRFEVGDIAGYEGVEEADLVVSLHACDTATDAALDRAVRAQASVILAVPCCQHELQPQLESRELEPLLRRDFASASPPRSRTRPGAVARSRRLRRADRRVRRARHAEESLIVQ
jgi:hypothetical protein